MARPIYLDNHATTRLDPYVLKAMMPYLEEEYGNPASVGHEYGWRAKEAVEEARQKVARFVGAEPHNIIFTSGATESNNIVLRGASVRTVAVAGVEHKSVLVPARGSHLRQETIPVDHHGMIVVKEAFFSRFGSDHLVSVMGANNEVGTIQPLFHLAAIKMSMRDTFLLHADMAQMLGRERTDMRAMELDFASFSAHKVYGPKGVGALYVSDNARDRLSRLMFGGRQESGLRPGTVNVPGVVGFGAACELAARDMDQEQRCIRRMRDGLQKKLEQEVPGLVVYGHPEKRLAGNLCLGLPCKNMTAFMARLEPEIGISSGSACSGFSGRSHVLEAMGVPENSMQSVIRIGIGRFNTVEDMDKAADAIIRALDMANKGG
jgi:cysteine desulfurase